MTKQYFNKGFVTFRDLKNALLGVGGGGLESWNPITEPTKIQAGIYTSPGSFILLEDYNGSPIDDISSASRGDIIYFFSNNNRWAVVSAEDKNKGVYQTLAQLQTAYPNASNGDYALVVATNSFFAWYNSQWNNTGSNIAPDALRSTNNLSDLTDDAVARTNLDVYSKSETDTAISNGLFNNSNIASDANIETSKIQQITIEPKITAPANGDTQKILNDKFTGNIQNISYKLDNLPVGASSGETIYFTGTDDLIIPSYKQLSKSPSTTAQTAISAIANNNTVLAGSFVLPTQLNVSKLDAGIWQFNIYAYADHAASCRIIVRVYKRSTLNTETLLFEATSQLISSVDANNPELLTIEIPQQNIPVLITDELVVKIFVLTTRTSDTAITFYHSGNQYFSHIHTPLVANHNDLKGIQGGGTNDYNHLTTSQVNLVNSIENYILKVSGAINGNFPVFNNDGSLSSSDYNSGSFEPKNSTILKQGDVVNNLTSTSINLPLSANQGKILNESKVNTEGFVNLATDAVAGNLLDTNSIDFAYDSITKKITANARINNPSANAITISIDVNGINADIKSGSIDNSLIKSNANISPTKILLTADLQTNIGNIAKDDLLSVIIDKIATLLPIHNNTSGKYLSSNKTWSDLNQNAVGISSSVRKDAGDNTVISTQATTDSGSQGNVLMRMGNNTTGGKGGDLIFQPSNSSGGSGDFVIRTSARPYGDIEIGSTITYTSSNIQNATFAHTVPSGKQNRLLVVSISTPASAPVSAVSYGGQAMTQISTGAVASTNNNIQTFYLVNPPEGTANIVITKTNSSGISAGATNFFNVNQATPILNATENFNSNQTTSASVSITTVAGQIALAVIGVVNVSPTNNGTTLFSLNPGTSERSSSAYKLATTTTTNITFNFSNSSFAIHGFAINPVSSTDLGTMQDTFRFNSQGGYGNIIKECSIFNSAQTLILTEDLPQNLIFTSSVAANSSITLPDATRMLVGTPYNFINYNNYSVNVNNKSGTTIATISGNNKALSLILTSNSTVAGTWSIEPTLSSGLINNLKQESTRFVEGTYGLDTNDGLTPFYPFLTAEKGWTDVNSSGQVKLQGSKTYNIASQDGYSFPSDKTSVKTVLDAGAKITGIIKLVDGNTSMQFVGGKIGATISDASTGTVYMDSDIGGATINFTAGGYKYIANSSSAPTLINLGTLASGSGTLVLANCNGPVPISIGSGWTVIKQNTQIAVASQSATGYIFDTQNLFINAIITSQTALNAILSTGTDGLYIANFASPTGITGILQGDIFVKSGAIVGIINRFNDAPSAVSVLDGTGSIGWTKSSNKTWVSIIASQGGGNVSSSLTGVDTGQLLLAGNSTATSLTIPNGDPSQRRVLSKTTKLIASFTTAERDAITDWVSGDTIFNSTIGINQRYIGSSWINCVPQRVDLINFIKSGVNGGGTLAGSAFWNTNSTGGRKTNVTLTSPINNQKGYWYKNIPQFASQNKRFRAEINHSAGGGNGADGIYYSFFANAAPVAGDTNTKTNNSYTIYFSEYDKKIYLYYNGSLLNSQDFFALDYGGNDSIKSITINLEWNYTTNLTNIKIEIKGSNFGVGFVMDYQDNTVRDLSGQYLIVGGITGGANNYHFLQCLELYNE